MPVNLFNAPKPLSSKLGIVMIHLALYIVSIVIVAVAALFVLSLGFAIVARIFIRDDGTLRGTGISHERVQMGTVVHRRIDPKTIGWMIVIGSAIVLACI